MERFKIEDVANQTGLTKRTIRFYEEIGLIEPPERSEGGIRLYTRQEVEHLKKIVDAKEVLGFSLQELQYFLQLNETIERLRREYRTATNRETRRQELAQIAETLQEQLAMIQTKLQKMSDFKQEGESLLAKVRKILESEA